MVLLGIFVFLRWLLPTHDKIIAMRQIIKKLGFLGIITYGKIDVLFLFLFVSNIDN